MLRGLAEARTKKDKLPRYLGMSLVVGGDSRAGGGYAIRVGVLVATSREQQRCSLEKRRQCSSRHVQRIRNDLHVFEQPSRDF